MKGRASERRKSDATCLDVPLLRDGFHEYLWLSPQQSLPPVLCTLIRRHGPCDVSVVTFSAAPSSVVELARLSRSLRMVMHETAGKRGTDLETIRSLCTDLQLRRVHAKVAILRGDGWGLTVSGSANLARSNGWERILIEAGTAHADAELRTVASKLDLPWL